MTSIADEIDRLAAQRAAGHLTEAEFEAAKARLFGAPPSSDWRAATGEANATINRLRRSTTDRWIGGVCGGIAKSVGVDAWIVRLAFVIGTFSFGIGFLPYALLWIFVPSEGR